MTKFLPIKIQLLFILIGLNYTTHAQNALRFDGIDDYIQTDYKGIEGDGARTVEAWIKVKPSNTWRFIVDMGSTGPGQRFSFKINNNARFIRIEVGGGGIYGSTPITDNKWHHVAATYDPDLSENQFKLYVDGNLDKEGDLDLDVNTSKEKPVRIGYSNYNLGPFEGLLDEVRVWSVARTAEEIKDHMNTEICQQSNLELYYRFNQGIPNGNNKGMDSALEYTGSPQNSTLIGFDLIGTNSNWVEGSPITPIDLDNTVSVKNTTLTANLKGATYQWIDCSNRNAQIKGATSPAFTPSTIGNYAVKITNEGGCMEFSKCITISSLEAIDNSLGEHMSLIKNELESGVSIDLGSSFTEIQTKLININGHIISEKRFWDVEEFEVDIDQNPGLYFIHITTNSGDSGILTVVKQ
ncbi:LamG domain-containing protein [Mangrovimonas sp. TPBH4]|uniref:LamG domain-containing protein n=1 Tax=Mangrovimonas sp. TPBH4 TaxID=1645914 RepID=UPI0006B508E1|nr:LamG domain-containing protein [Mangrovimonas sp. TPBH4]